MWFSQNPSKRWGELFFLLYTPFWLTLCLGIVVPYKLYEVISYNQYSKKISALRTFLVKILQGFNFQFIKIKPLFQDKNIVQNRIMVTVKEYKSLFLEATKLKNK